MRAHEGGREVKNWGKSSILTSAINASLSKAVEFLGQRMTTATNTSSNEGARNIPVVRIEPFHRAWLNLHEATSPRVPPREVGKEPRAGSDEKLAVGFRAAAGRRLRSVQSMTVHCGVTEAKRLTVKIVGTFLLTSNWMVGYQSRSSSVPHSELKATARSGGAKDDPCSLANS